MLRFFANLFRKLFGGGGDTRERGAPPTPTPQPPEPAPRPEPVTEPTVKPDVEDPLPDPGKASVPDRTVGPKFFVNGVEVLDLPLDPDKPDGARRFFVLPPLHRSGVLRFQSVEPPLTEEQFEAGRDELSRGMVPPFWGHLFLSVHVDGAWGSPEPSVKFLGEGDWLEGEVETSPQDRTWKVSKRHYHRWRIHVTPYKPGDRASIDIKMPVTYVAPAEEGETWISIAYQSPQGDGFNAKMQVLDS